MSARLTDAQRHLLRWGGRHRRELPWRATRDPWSVLVSEVMLQQTQVGRVVERYGGFLDRYPDPAALAAAPLGEVLAAWQGLGYPRRARDLWRAADACVRDHGGEVPTELEALLELPGVGPYTARAVLAFALETDVGVVDTNIARVLARHGGRRLTPTRAQGAADAWVPPGRSWRWNQSLMDLGAGVCRPRDPRCGDCPLADSCAWAGSGRAHPDPAEGSAHVSRRQARFEGSDRQARGRLLARLADGPLERSGVAGAAGLEDQPHRVEAVVASLAADGLVEVTDGRLRLP